MSFRSLALLALLVFPARASQPRARAPRPGPPGPRTIAITATARALAGCYALRARPWSVSAPALPAIIRLDAAPTNAFEPGLRMSPDITTFHELPYAPAWRPDGPEALIVSWFDGFTGPRARLVHRGDARGGVWEGVARFDYHDGAPGGRTPTAAVAATRVPCADVQPRTAPR